MYIYGGVWISFQRRKAVDAACGLHPLPPPASPVGEHANLLQILSDAPFTGGAWVKICPCKAFMDRVVRNWMHCER